MKIVTDSGTILEIFSKISPVIDKLEKEYNIMCEDAYKNRPFFHHSKLDLFGMLSLGMINKKQIYVSKEKHLKVKKIADKYGTCRSFERVFSSFKNTNKKDITISLSGIEVDVFISAAKIFNIEINSYNTENEEQKNLCDIQQT